MQPYGDSSPLGLLGTFLGASVPYSVFTGMGELAGGLLLTLRRTTLFGALVGIGVLSNGVMLNLGYDGSAKLSSLHLLLMAVFLAAPDLRRLTHVLVLNHPAEPAEIRPLFRRKGHARTAAAIAAVFILYTTGTRLHGSYGDLEEHGPKAASRSPLYGMWNVEELVVDEKQGRLFLSRGDDSNWRTALAYRRPQPDLLLVAGPFDGHQVRARLRRTEPPEFLLVTRGFHWISERAFSR